MEEITRFGRKDCLSLPGLGWRYFNSLSIEEDEPIYTYNDNYMIWPIRHSIEGGRVCAFKYYYKSKICDDLLKIVSEELNMKGNIYDILEAYLKYKNKLFKIYEKDYENEFDEYRDEDVKEKEICINKKLRKLPIHQLKKQIKLADLLWDYDAVILYPNAMWDEKWIYPRIETGYAFTEDMKDDSLKNSILVILTKEVLFLKLSITIQKL